MPSQSDVEDALVDVAATALYPRGVSSLPAILAESRIYRGWPNAAALETDLAAGVVNVTVFPTPNATSITTRYLADWTAEPVAPTLEACAAGNTATFSGLAEPGQLAGILVDRQSFVHRTTTGDTPDLIAAILTSAIAVYRPATVTQSTITIPYASSVIARTAADASATLELRRQVQGFRISVWCPTPDLRDATCNILDVVIAGLPFLCLPGGFFGRLQYSSTTTFDSREDAGLYRRDILVTVEFPTTQVAVQPSMLFGTLGLGATIITA